VVGLRQPLARLAAPAAALLAVTVALLLVRATLTDGREADRTAAASGRATTVAARAAAPARQARRAPAPTAAPEFYEIEAGDTLGAVAARHGTSVEALAGLNPGVDPTALQVGQRIRVK
jgi:Tfp pilus assembly protein FimV